MQQNQLKCLFLECWYPSNTIRVESPAVLDKVYDTIFGHLSPEQRSRKRTGRGIDGIFRVNIHALHRNRVRQGTGISNLHEQRIAATDTCRQVSIGDSNCGNF